MAKTRDSKPVEELDVASWMEAALVSQANTLAEKEQSAMQQNASIARLQAAVESQDWVIAAQMVPNQFSPTKTVRPLVSPVKQSVQSVHQSKAVGFFGGPMALAMNMADIHLEGLYGVAAAHMTESVFTR